MLYVHHALDIGDQISVRVLEWHPYLGVGSVGLLNLPSVGLGAVDRNSGSVVKGLTNFPEIHFAAAEINDLRIRRGLCRTGACQHRQANQKPAVSHIDPSKQLSRRAESSIGRPRPGGRPGLFRLLSLPARRHLSAQEVLFALLNGYAKLRGVIGAEAGLADVYYPRVVERPLAAEAGIGNGLQARVIGASQNQKLGGKQNGNMLGRALHTLRIKVK